VFLDHVGVPGHPALNPVLQHVEHFVDCRRIVLVLSLKTLEDGIEMVAINGRSWDNLLFDHILDLINKPFAVNNRSIHGLHHGLDLSSHLVKGSHPPLLLDFLADPLPPYLKIDPELGELT
jgi:hypothetical protein